MLTLSVAVSTTLSITLSKRRLESLAMLRPTSRWGSDRSLTRPAIVTDSF